MAKSKTIKNYEYGLTGFPVVIDKVQMLSSRGLEFPMIDPLSMNRALLLCLAEKKTKLTGNQVRYIRLSFELSLAKFSRLFGFTAPSVLKWEQQGDFSTAMEWPAELMLRTMILLRSNTNAAAAKVIRSLIHGGELPPAEPGGVIRITLPDMAIGEVVSEPASREMRKAAGF